MLYLPDHTPITKPQLIQSLKLLISQLSVVNDLLLLLQKIHQIFLLFVCEFNTLNLLYQVLNPLHTYTHTHRHRGMGYYNMVVLMVL